MKQRLHPFSLCCISSIGLLFTFIPMVVAQEPPKALPLPSKIAGGASSYTPEMLQKFFRTEVASYEMKVVNASRKLTLREEPLLNWQNQSVSTSSNPIALPNVDPNRWMVVLCSLGGDAEHEERLTEAVNQVFAAAGPVFGVQPERIRVMLSGKEMAKKIPKSKPCNRSSLAELAVDLTAASNSQSQYLFFVLGHSHLDGRSCQFNIAGPDIDQLD